MNHYFATLPQQYRFIAVDADGTASAYTERPELDGDAWVPTAGNGHSKVLGTGRPGEFDTTGWEACVFKREPEAFDQLSQDITARQHYAFELFKIGVVESPFNTGAQVENMARRSYAIADMFLRVGEE